MSDPDIQRPPIAREPRQTECVAETLFDAEPTWRDYWWGMPEYEMNDCRPYVTLTVHFSSWDDVLAFSDTIGATVTRNTKSVWYGEQITEAAKDWCYE